MRTLHQSASRRLAHAFEVTGAEGARFVMVASRTFTEFIRAASGEKPPPPETLTEIAADHAIEILAPRASPPERDSVEASGSRALPLRHARSGASGSQRAYSLRRSLL